MTVSVQQQAEMAALAQRIQLNSLTKSLQTLDRQLSFLELKSARQSADLEEMERMIGDLYVAHGLQRPDPTDLEAIPWPDSGAGPAAGAGSSKLRSGLLSGGNEDWQTYMERVEQYLTDEGVDDDAAPLLQLVPSSLGADIKRRYKDTYCAAAWERLDYGIVGVAVLTGALLDFFLVATPNGSFRGQPQRESPLTRWMKEQSEKFAPIKPGDSIQRNAFESWVANLTTAAEGYAKVPYDVVIPKDGLTPNVHRLASPGHDPVLQLVFGVLDIVSAGCIFIGKTGRFERISGIPGHDPTINVPEAIVRVIAHGFSDVFTPKGLPAPFMGLFQLLGFDSGFVVSKGGGSLSVQDLTRYMYSNGYDLRHFMSMAIVPGVAEIILSVYHAVRDYKNHGSPGKASMPDRLKRQQMLLLTHALLSSANVLKTALYGWNPMALNLAQYMTLATRMFTMIKLTCERDQRVKQELEQGWHLLQKDAARLPDRSRPSI